MVDPAGVVVVTGAGAGAGRAIAQRFGSAIQAIVGQMITLGPLNRYTGKTGWDGQVSRTPNPHGPDNLYESVAGHQSARDRFGTWAKPGALILDPAKLRFAMAFTALSAAFVALRTVRSGRPNPTARASHGA